MMKTMPLTESLFTYVVDHCESISPVLADLRAETAKLPHHNMQISPDQGSLLYLLTKLVNAKKVLEIGCFTGYSAICMAAALPSDGHLLTLDINKETAAIAKRFFIAADLAHKIKQRLAPALTSLNDLKEAGEAGSYDLVFIDADKMNMIAYYEEALTLLRTGGLIVADNVLWAGAVVDKQNNEESTVAIRRFNEHVKNDQRVEKVMLHVSDGLYLARKR